MGSADSSRLGKRNQTCMYGPLPTASCASVGRGRSTPPDRMQAKSMMSMRRMLRASTWDASSRAWPPT
eukprot:scaffold299914_cov32-Prasinocladus_malaysianus.AAC.1